AASPSLVYDFRMELQAGVAVDVGDRRKAAIVGGGNGSITSRDALDQVAMAHPHVEGVRDATKEIVIRLAHADAGAAVFASVGPLDRATHLMSDELHPVANGEDWDFG